MDHDIQGDEELSQNDELWDKAQNNEWYRWAAFTAIETGKLGMFLGIAILIGGLLFCCVLPTLRKLIVNATVKQMEMLKSQIIDK